MFCWHSWNKWCDPFQGVWSINQHQLDTMVDKICERPAPTQVLMTQRRTCKKCGKVQYRKCR